MLVITGSTEKPPKILEIETAESYDGDFTLRLEFRASRDANSGLHLRDKVFAHQLQIRDYPRVGPYKTLKNYKEGDWNEIEVVVTGTKARCTCNGEILEAALNIPGKGPLALQSEINPGRVSQCPDQEDGIATNLGDDRSRLGASGVPHGLPRRRKSRRNRPDTCLARPGLLY